MAGNSKRWKYKRQNSSSISSCNSKSDPDYEVLDSGEVQERKWNSTRKKRNLLENENGQGKMIKATILSWLIDRKIVEENAKVIVMDESFKQMTPKRGSIKREGILCCCCYKVLTAAAFYSHSGGRSARPYDNIFIAKTQISLLSCMDQAWDDPEECQSRKFNLIDTNGSEASDSYDDACMICADGGNLMCCDKCNSTYHQSCLNMVEIPKGSWYCPYCVCKFCGKPVKKENDYLLTCPQCEKKYHWKCHQEREPITIELNSFPDAPFCEKSCKEVYVELEKNMVGVKNELPGGYSWSLLHRLDKETGIHMRDSYQRTVCHSKLAVARRLMKDCFEEILDRHTGIDVIKSIVYNCGANFNRINFRGFHTAVLEKDEEIITVATLRIHGSKLAEMPFIATSDVYRCKGMCRKLMAAIESALCYLNVENLVIPSVSERIRSWMEKYDFHNLDAAAKKEIKRRNTLTFHDAVRLQKTLLSLNLNRTKRASKRENAAKEARRNSHHCLQSSGTKSTKTAAFDLNLEPPEY